jgi:hypothetical protein
MPLCSHKLMYWPLYSRISKHGPARPESDVDQFDTQCYFHLPLQPSPDPALEPWRRQKPGNLAAKEHLIASLPTRLSYWVELPQNLPSPWRWKDWKTTSMAAVEVTEHGSREHHLIPAYRPAVVPLPSGEDHLSMQL